MDACLFDTVIHGGTVVTASDSFPADIGIRDGRIAVVAERIDGGATRIDAGGRLVMPGGIETHCHIAQESSSGIVSADDYRSGSISAAFGGTPASFLLRRSSTASRSTRCWRPTTDGPSGSPSSTTPTTSS